MSWLGRLVGGREERQGPAEHTLMNPGDFMLTTPTYSGERVSVEGALKFPAVLACVSLISSSVAGMPLVTYRRQDENKVRDMGGTVAGMLHDKPNPDMAADELWEIVTAHLLLWGNAFLAKIRDGSGQVVELWPLSPGRVQVTRKGGERLFAIDGRPYDSHDVLHIRALSGDGLVGYSRIQLMRQTLGNMAAQQKFQGKFLAEGGKPSVILRHPNKLSREAAERLKASWAHVRSGGTAVLEEGTEVTQWSMPLTDAQFIQQADHSAVDIARIFQVPPGMIGAKTGDSLTYSTTWQNGRHFVNYSLGPWMRRIEGALRADPALFPAATRFPEFLADGLLRTDTKTRYEAYKVALDARFLTVDEVRAMENRPALNDAAEPMEGEADEA